MALIFPMQFDMSFGVAFVGGVVASALYGIDTAQAVVFFQSFPHESFIIKCSVGFVWAMGTLETILYSHALYTLMVSNFSEALAIILVPWSYWAGLLVSTAGGTVIRMFFAYRIWKLSHKNILLTVPLIILSMVVLVNAAVLATLGMIKIPNVFILRNYSLNIYLAFSSVILGDVVFATLLAYYIWRARRLNRNGESSPVLDTAMVYMVNTGLICSVLAIICLVMYAAFPNTYWYIAFLVPQGKLYVTAMFSTLNTRTWSHAGVDDARVPIMTINGNPTIPVAFADAPPPEMEVHVDREVIKVVTHG